ncbi:MAG: aminoglycoside phosphotransferase family protein [Acidobacteriota bacterium]|nr:aminoglycoside phosphotransferase family protein [Acidobacteriota bacterium]
MEDFTAKERRARAIEAAAEIAATYHIKADAPVILKDSNNTVIHLSPAPVVAKVATSTLRKQNISNLGHELNVALHLADSGAPVVPPSAEIPPAVYRHKDLEVTFWQYCAGEIREEIDRPELAAALKEFHTAFASYRGALKSFTKDYEECYSLLSGDRLSPELSSAERQFLRRVYEHLSASLQAFDCERVPVHTEIHGGNVLWVGGEPLLIDFESCCRGPRELDFLFLTEGSLSAYPDLDKRLMEILGGLRSFRVAVWCWAQPSRAPEVREAAEYHLSRLHGLN